jgi:aspartyl protease family protein
MGKFALFVIAFALVVAYAMPAQRPPSPETEERPAVVVAPDVEQQEPPSPLYASEIRLDRQADGHFYADAEINGTRVRFLVDTGASTVALTEQDARRIGIPFFSSEFEVVGRGASGDVRGKRVTLDRVRIGNAEVDSVDAAVIADADTSLLGQSFLRHLHSVEIRDDRMILR